MIVLIFPEIFEENQIHLWKISSESDYIFQHKHRIKETFTMNDTELEKLDLLNELDKLKFLNELQDDIKEVREFYHDTKSVEEIAQFIDLHNTLEIQSEKKTLIVNLLKEKIGSIDVLSRATEDPQQVQIMDIYLDAFLKICIFHLDESEDEENLRHQNHRSLRHFADIYKDEIVRLREKFADFKDKLDDKTAEKLKVIEENREKLGDADEEFDQRIQNLTDEFAKVNEEKIEKFIEIINEMEKSVDEGHREVAENEKLWLKEVHKLAAQR